ncbi:uncharacterized protein K444DRAFT_91857 [Hyaloscypha bicolor E]|uniref:Uncharacterized protein n=1 Tax=Hyaloscypha bicolor E TaxID=1095630 RepID=A0A2J6SVM6_9HELO|nr:uncharacterized protein K444DRAFT_91857 [Hyaloscypha bicolor E]PMD54830.1 hypothetical protein K444DRAFT_91857 [Hyaloscypha bicolor E]
MNETSVPDRVSPARIFRSICVVTPSPTALDFFKSLDSNSLASFLNLPIIRTFVSTSPLRKVRTSPSTFHLILSRNSASNAARIPAVNFSSNAPSTFASPFSGSINRMPISNTSAALYKRKIGQLAQDFRTSVISCCRPGCKRVINRFPDAGDVGCGAY